MHDASFQYTGVLAQLEDIARRTGLSRAVLVENAIRLMLEPQRAKGVKKLLRALEDAGFGHPDAAG